MERGAAKNGSLLLAALSARSSSQSDGEGGEGESRFTGNEIASIRRGEAFAKIRSAFAKRGTAL